MYRRIDESMDSNVVKNIIRNTPNITRIFNTDIFKGAPKLNDLYKYSHKNNKFNVNTQNNRYYDNYDDLYDNLCRFVVLLYHSYLKLMTSD